MSKTQTKKKTKRRFHGFRFLTTLLIMLVGFELVVGGVALMGLSTFLKEKPELVVEDFLSQQSTHIYDSTGAQIADIGTQLRENITYNQVPEALVDAFLSIEDSRYFEHNGFDIPRFSKAILETLLHGNMQGGSTFTMQLVKLTYFENDSEGTSKTKDIEYKIQQIALAMELEKYSNKKSIVELYLNKMNFGGIGNIRGVQKASQQYYGKSVSELNISECAMLAGVVNAPYYYDPHIYLDHATERRNAVLYQMNNHGYITDKEYELAKSVKVEDLLIDPYESNTLNSITKYQAYIDEVIKEAERISGQDPFNVSMNIYTAMRPDVQEAIETMEAGENPAIVFWDDLSEVGIVSLNNKTGEIVGIGGGRNYANGGAMLLNHATEQWKQPGSSCKPFMDYALAFEYAGWATSHVVEDKPVSLGNWVYKNYSGTYSGDITVMDALAMSLNTTAIQALQAAIDAVGLEPIYQYLEAMNFSQFDRNTFDIGYAIGGNNFRASPKEMAAASGIIVSNGLYYEPHTITKIEYRNGNKEPLIPVYEGKQVLSPQAAYMTSRLMRNNVDTSAQIGNLMDILIRPYPVFAKTGTTDWGTDGLPYGIPEGVMKDKWLVSQTTQYTTAVWMGYEKAIAGQFTWVDLNKQNQRVEGWISSVLLDILNTEAPADVERPAGLTDITHIKGLYPYTAPIQGMPAEYITTGMIKDEYATLAAPQGRTAIDTLSSFTARADKSSIALSWAPYPHPAQLGVASTTKDISLRDAAGNVLASAYGRRMFDYSWIWGAVEYKARIMQGGQEVREITSTTSDMTIGMEGLAPNTETQVCGFYGYNRSGDKSNEICSTFTTPKRTVIAPSRAVSLSDLQSWLDSNSITLSDGSPIYLEETGSNPAGTVLILQNGRIVSGQEIQNDVPVEIRIYEQKRGSNTEPSDEDTGDEG